MASHLPISTIDVTVASVVTVVGVLGVVDGYPYFIQFHELICQLYGFIL